MTKLESKEMITSIAEVARYINKSRWTVYRYISMGKINPIKPYRGEAVYDKRELNKLK